MKNTSDYCIYRIFSGVSIFSQYNFFEKKKEKSSDMKFYDGSNP